MTGQIQPIGKPPGGNLIRPGGPRPPVNAPPMTITPKEIIGILRRHILMIICSTVIGVIIGGGSWFLLLRFAPKYTATASIEVLPPGKSDPMTFASAQANKDLFYQFRATKAAFIKQQSMLQELLKRDKIRETAWFMQFDNNTADAVDKLKKKMGANAQREGNWIVISMTCKSKKESALIVNEMADLFFKSQLEMATRDIRAQLAERTKQQKLIKTQLLQAEDSLDIIRKGTSYTNLAGAGTFNDYLNRKLANIEMSYDELESDVSRLEAIIVTLRERATGGYDEVIREQMERDPVAQSMRQTIASLELSLAQQLTRFGENHRRVKEMRDTLKQAKSDRIARQSEIADIQRRSTLRNAEDSMTAFTKELETLHKQRIQARSEIKEIDNLRAGYERIMQIRDEKRILLENITDNIEKYNMAFRDPEISKIKRLGAAPEPLAVSFPKLIVFIPAGFMLGAMAGVGLAFAVELLNDLIRTPSDVRKHLNIPLLGMVYHADEDENIDQIDLCHVVRQAPYSMMSECYRQFRTNLRIKTSDSSNKVFLVTSCGTLAGKTTVSVNLSNTFVAEGMNVLLIDTNFRKPTSLSLFPPAHSDRDAGRHSDFGLSNYLMGQCQYEQVIRNSGIENLDIIDSGPLPANPAEILGNARMSELISKTKDGYDYVIVDGPPMLVSEAKILATSVDGIVFVLNSELTHRGAAQRIIRELKNINVNVLGGVLLGVRALKGGYFQEIFNSYQQYQDMQVYQPI